jgi:hypothetical protein
MRIDYTHKSRRQVGRLTGVWQLPLNFVTFKHPIGSAKT